MLLFLALFQSFSIKVIAGLDPNFHIYLAFERSNMESGGKMDVMDWTVDKRFRSSPMLRIPIVEGKRALGTMLCRPLATA